METDTGLDGPNLEKIEQRVSIPDEEFIGDVVLIAEKTSRGHWPLGKVTVVYPGSDGVVRTVEVKTAPGTFRRPATRIAVIEECSSENC